MYQGLAVDVPSDENIGPESQQNHLSELVVSTEGNQISQSDIDSKAPDTESSLFERQEANNIIPAAIATVSLSFFIIRNFCYDTNM